MAARRGLALGLLAFAVQAQEPDLEARVRLLEQRLSSRALVEMLQRVDQLQHEVQALRGQVETLQNQVERLRRDMAERSLTVDEGANGGTGEPGSAEPQTPASVQTREASSEVVRQAYRRAFDQLQAGHYDAAIDAFSEFLQRHPESPLAANAYYWLGEAYYVKRDFRAAGDAFSQVVAHFPASPKAADAALKLGYVAYEQRRWQEARRRLEEVVRRFPGTQAARLAEERLARMKREGRF